MNYNISKENIDWNEKMEKCLTKTQLKMYRMLGLQLQYGWQSFVNFIFLYDQGTEVKAITYSNMQVHDDDDKHEVYVIIDI